jgi:MFS family permease
MTSPAPGLRDRVPIYALLAANSVPVVGNAMTAMAVPWFVLLTTGSAALTGITGAVIALGSVLAAFFGGPVVDRLGFKKTSVVSDLMSGLTVALFPLLHSAVGLAFWQLLALVFLGSVFDAPGMSARDALMPELAGLAGMPIERANSFDTAIPRLAQFLGPPLAGLLIVALGATGVLWLDAATFAFSAALVAAAVPASAARAARNDEAGEGGAGASGATSRSCWRG